MAFGQHLRANQNLRFATARLFQFVIERTFAAGGVTIDAADCGVRKVLV